MWAETHGVDCAASAGALPEAASLSVSPHEYAAVARSRAPHVLLDVRERAQFAICALPAAINIPLR